MMSSRKNRRIKAFSNRNRAKILYPWMGLSDH